MTDLRAKLLEFHTAMGVPIATVPAVPADDRVRLRARLIVEECLEFLQACFDVREDVMASVRGKLAFLVDNVPVNVDLPEAADALADISYVVFGAAAELGVDLDAVLEEVHRANLTKAGGPIREDGKRMKPPGFVPADVAAVLRRQGWKR